MQIYFLVDRRFWENVELTQQYLSILLHKYSFQPPDWYIAILIYRHNRKNRKDMSSRGRNNFWLVDKNFDTPSPSEKY